MGRQGQQGLKTLRNLQLLVNIKILFFTSQQNWTCTHPVCGSGLEDLTKPGEQLACTTDPSRKDLGAESSAIYDVNNVALWESTRSNVLYFSEKTNPSYLFIQEFVSSLSRRRLRYKQRKYAPNLFRLHSIWYFWWTWWKSVD